MTGRVLTTALGILGCAGAAAAATEVNSNITEDTTWTAAGSPYIIKRNVTVRLGKTLTIEPGVTVAFDGDYFLQTDSTYPLSAIVAEGAVGDSVIFTSNLAGPWAGIWEGVKAFNSAGSSFRYCVFEYADSGLRLDTCSPPVEHCAFRLCTFGIYCKGTTSAITSCDVLNCNLTGIICEGPTAAPVIDDCNIDNPVVWAHNVRLQSYPIGNWVSIDAGHNWWGTDVESQIQAKIYDSMDDPDLYATVLYTPWYSAPGVEPSSWGSIKAMFRD